ncbi:MAG: PSD1 and planctomycete cytochrome C domain-containing protein, partial [Pirellulales bacterium]|nr:PSD1 and planctomycete cytochrome C domain-containing protein [Pirellulales bacterium]
MKHVKLNWLLIWGWLAVPAQVNADDTSFFESKIRPVLVKHCYQCHSSDAKNIKGGLVLDSKDGWQKGGDVGPSIIPGKPTESLLYKAITWQDSDIQMPPDNALPKSVVADFRKWIEDGAVDPRTEGASSGVAVFDLEARRDEHWAWRAYTQSGESKRESVDYYVNRSLRRAGLRASDPATKTELIRRLSFDLTGLPPSKEDLECTSIDDYVDQLLRSPHFGEHWARHWLDVVRFCETKGHVPDADRFYAWKYRDYVVDAFNSDLPFNQFVTEHLAGDLLATEQQRAGANGVTNISVTATGALFMHDMHFMVVDPVRQRWDQINSQIEMVGKAFLGLTLDCARCHDHKFDAVSQRDYYALAGVFYSTEQGVSRTGPRAANLSEETVAVEKKYREYLNGQIQQRRKAQTPKADGKYFPISEELGIQSPNQVKDVQNLIDQLEELDPSWQHWVRSAKEADITTNVSLLVRGDHRNEGEVIPRGFLTALEAESDFPESGSGRMWLAEQITSEKNPLTARVWVNRLWQQLFGHGIVRTPNNFGKLGSAPTHPALLDYLARRLVESDWSMKTVIKEIVMSNAYQRSSEASPKSQENEPANK